MATGRGRSGRLGADFGRLFTANLASSLGDGIARTAAPLLAVSLTDDPLLVSGVAALAMLPWLLFALPAGVLIDRVDRRRALAAANSLRALLALALLVLATTGTLTIASLFVVVFLLGVGETVYDGSVRAVTPALVPKALLPTANGRIEAGELVVQNFLSGPFTSLLLAVAVAIPLGVNAAAFAVAAVLALFLPAVAARGARPAADPAVDPAPVRESLRAQFAAGLRFIWANRMLRTLWLFSTTIGVLFSAGQATVVLFFVERLGVDEAFWGVFLVVGAVGGIIGAQLAGPLARRLGAGPTMAIANLASAVVLTLPGVVPNLAVLAVAFFLTSLTVIVWNVHVMSLRQSIIPARLLGRVHGTWRTLLWGAMPVGSVLGGLLARIDLATPFLVGGGVSIVLSLVFYRFLARLPNPGDVSNGDEPTDAGPTDPTVVD